MHIWQLSRREPARDPGLAPRKTEASLPQGVKDTQKPKYVGLLAGL